MTGDSVQYHAQDGAQAVPGVPPVSAAEMAAGPQEDN
jgi:hypothetical protein